METIENGSGGVIIHNYDPEDNVVINGTPEIDVIISLGNYVTINAGEGDNTVYNGGVKDDLTTYFGGSYAVINAGSGNDMIDNIHGDNVTIQTSGGNDTIINNSGSQVSIDSGVGNDIVENYDGNEYLTIIAGTGDDTINLHSAVEKNMIQYTLGDGNDIVYGFNATDTLNIFGSGHTSVASGNDIIITVDDGGTITLKDVGSSSDLSNNIVSNSTNVDSTTPAPTSNFTLESSTNYNGHTYYLISTTAESGAQAWNDANTWLGTNYGAYLAVINDEAENTALYNLISGKTSEAYFGLTDAGHEGTWTWIDGSTPTYINWADNEPTGGEFENHAYFFTHSYGSKWNDGDVGFPYIDTNEQKLYFLGEADSVPVSTTTVTNNTAPTDVIFLIDKSGSMSPYIQKIKNALTSFANFADDNSETYRFGAVEFGASTNGGQPTLKLSLTNNSKDLIDALDTSVEGGAEYGLTAVQMALDMFDGRDAQKRIVALTDEGYQENDSGSALTAEEITGALKSASVKLDVVGKMGARDSDDNLINNSYNDYNCQYEYEPIANSTGGKFYDINNFNFDIVIDDILGQPHVIIDLSTVESGATGVFVVQVQQNEAGENVLVSSTATRKATAETGDNVVGTITTANNYVADFTSTWRQVVTVPENWAVGGTHQNDTFNVIGSNATVSGSLGKDNIYLGENTMNTTIVDVEELAKGNDLLSFSKKIEPGNLKQQPTDAGLNLYYGNNSFTLMNTTSLSDDLLNCEVSNYDDMNTISELLYGDKDDMYQLSLAQFNIGFTPPENSWQYAHGVASGWTSTNN